MNGPEANDGLLSESLQYIAGLAFAALSAAVAFIWRQLGRVDKMSDRVDILADAVEDVVDRQNTLEHEQGDQRVLLAEMRNDVKWIRETLEDHRR